MSKRKTVLKFVIPAVLLGGSSALAVLYFPYVALAIKFGVVPSIAPLAIFAISAMVALASVITLTASVVSALRSNGKPSEVDEKLKSKNQDEERSLVQEEEKAVPTPMPELLPEEPQELVTPVLQQQLGDNLIEEMETSQHEEDANFVDNGDSAEQQAEQTKGSLSLLPPYPELTSSMNSLESLPLPNPPFGKHNSSRNASPSIELLNRFDQSQPFPSLPSIVVDRHNSSRGDSNFVQNHGSFQIHDQLRVALDGFQNGIEVGRSKRAEMIRAFIPLMRLPSNSINEENQWYQSLPINQTMPYPNSLRRSRSFPNLVRTVTVEQQNVEEEFGEQEIQAGYNSTMTDSCSSWGTNWDDDSMMSLSLHQHTLSFGMPLIAEESAQDQNIESGPSAMLWDVNNQSLSGSPSRSNG